LQPTEEMLVTRLIQLIMAVQPIQVLINMTLVLLETDDVT
jgi:hypothetical protein